MICDQDVVLYRRTDGPLRRSKTPAGTGCCRYPWAVSRKTKSSADTTVSFSILRAAAHICRRRRPSIRPPVCALIRRSSAIAWSGCGRRSCTGGSGQNAGLSLERWCQTGSAKAARFYRLKCDYRLVIDNLMDLTHETYVHVGSIGDEAITSAPFEATHTERTATVARWMIDIEPPPFWAKHLGRPGRVDRWQIIYFQAPSVDRWRCRRGA